MKTLPIFITLIVFWGALSAQTNKPDIITSAGGYEEVNGISVSWTLGDIATSTETNGNVILTQGFQQNEFNIVTVEENLSTSFEIKLYPNPVSDQIQIDISGKYSGGIMAELIDINGKQVYSKLFDADTEKITIGFNSFAEGYYLLNLVNPESKIRNSYKIQKSE